MSDQKSTISDSDYPAIFISADTASKSGQKVYLLLTLLTLVFVVSGALLSVLSTAFPNYHSALSCAGAVLLAVSLVLNLAIGVRKPEKTWYGARAIAESAKTLTWRFMMAAAPYDLSMPASDAENKLLDDLNAVLHERASLGFALGVKAYPQITQVMRNIRGLGLRERVKTYLEDRIRCQCAWYARKAKESQIRSSLFFTLTIVSQVIALCLAIIWTQSSAPRWNLVGIFSATASAFLAWSAVKQYRETAQAYGLAAHDLGMIEPKADHIKTEAELSVFVSDSENAISREHTMWVARRDVR